MRAGTREPLGGFAAQVATIRYERELFGCMVEYGVPEQEVDAADATACPATDQRGVVRRRNLETGEEFDEAYDKLALCPGASPIVPPLPGVEHPRIHVLRRIGDMDRIKAAVDGSDGAPAKHAVVIGAGYIGLEIAENFHHRGVETVIVERGDQISEAEWVEFHRLYCAIYERKYGIPVLSLAFFQRLADVEAA